MDIKKRLLIVVVVALLATVSMIVIQNYNRKIVYGLINAIEENDGIRIEEYMSKSFNINTEYRALAETSPESALSIACDYGEFELAKRMVLEKGADVNYAPKGYAAPVGSIFSRYGKKEPNLKDYIDIYDFFIEHGADVKIGNPLFTISISLDDYILSLGEEDTIKLIDHVLDSGANYGHAQLITEASKINNLIILKHLIEDRKIKINYEKYYDRYALFEAVDNSSYECAKYLVSIGFRQDLLCDYPNYDGKTALEIAEEKDDKKMIEILNGGAQTN